MLRNTYNCGMKNFHRDLGLPKHFTLKGAIRRMQRQHPTLFKAVKFGASLFLTLSVSQILIPGNKLPFQTQIKQAVFKKIQSFGHFWYMSPINMDPYSYIHFLYMSLDYQLTNKICNAEDIASRMRKIQSTMEPDSLHNYSLNNEIKLENIFSAVEILNRIITYNEALLKEASIQEQYQRVLSNSVMKIEGKLKEEQKRVFERAIKVFQYVLKFGPPSGQSQVVEKMADLLNKPEQNALIAVAISKDEGLKKQISRIYSSNIQVRPAIAALVKAIDQLLQ